MAIYPKGVWQMIQDFINSLDIELSELTDNFNKKLEENSKELIKRICTEIDNIQDSFDILDNDFNERIKLACKNDKSHCKRMSEND